MPLAPDARYPGPTASDPDEAGGVHTHPKRVTRLLVPGWPSPAAHLHGGIVGERFPLLGGFARLVSVQHLRLSHRAHLLLLEGFPLHQLFLGGSLEGLLPPPLFLLQATHPRPGEPGYALRDVVLGQAEVDLSLISPTDVLSALLAHLASSSSS